MEDQENAIHKYICCLDEINICAMPKMIVGVTNYFICVKNCVFGDQ